MGIAASYGGLLPEKLINYFPLGILVIHPSLLPLFRWGSPVPATIVTDTNPTGVTILKMDSKFDHGPIITRFKEAVEPNDTYETLRDRLFLRSADVLVELIDPYLTGKIKPKSQDDSKATYARMIKKEDAFIPPEYFDAAVRGKKLAVSWNIPFIKPGFLLEVTPLNIERFIRAMSPWPRAWTYVCLMSNGQRLKKRIKILSSHIDLTISHQPLVIDEVQLEGKNTVTWKQFKEAYPKAKFEAE